MRLLTFFLGFLGFFTGIFAFEEQKSVLITYPSETPDSVIDETKAMIRQAKGLITHEFTLIKGFSAELGESALDSVKTLVAKYHALVEEDKMVSGK